MTCEPMRNVHVDTTQDLNAARRFASVEIAEAVAVFINESTNLGFAFPDDANPDDDADLACVVLFAGVEMYLA